MEHGGVNSHTDFARWLGAGSKAALLTGGAMLVPSGILLTGLSTGGLIDGERFGQTVLFVTSLILTLLFPLVMVTFSAIRRMEVTVAQVRDSIKFDSLTRVLTRSYFLDRVRGSSRNGYVLIVDADHFKSVNDTYGHAAGDAALIELALSLEWAVGPAGSVGRLGGEEFGVFFPGASRALAEKLAEDIRARVAANPIFVTGTEVGLTVSIGAAPYVSGEPLRAALSAADTNLFRAKERGRNQVVFDKVQPVPVPQSDHRRAVRFCLEESLHQ